MQLKNYAYFDLTGYSWVTRRERRAVEVNIMDTQEQYVSQHSDEDAADQIESPPNEKEKSEQSSSTMSKFLSSIGKKKLPSSSNVRSTTKNKLNEELITYRSLAQKEHNAIVEDNKEPNVVSATCSQN